MATKAVREQEVSEPEDEQGDGPLLDSVSAAVKKLVTKGKERGYITIDELNAAMPQDQVSSEQIEDTMTMMSELGINVIDGDDVEENADDRDGDGEAALAPTGGNLDDDDIGRTDDPVRMYLREMGSVELLSREGEIAIAKRIEAGREKMIGALCESPLTMRAISVWHDALVNEQMLLRDVIDLDASYGGGPDGEGSAMSEPVESDKTLTEAKAPKEEKGSKTAKPNGQAPEGEEVSDEEDEDEDEESSVSLAVMEAALKPATLETFDKIAATYGKLQRAQDKRMATLQKGEEVSKSTERTYERHRRDLVALMSTVRLNNSRIEQLVQQLYELNRLLTRAEGRLLRLALDTSVEREVFLEHYFGYELDPNWFDYLKQLNKRPWKNFIKKHAKEIEEIRAEVGKVAAAANMPLPEFRRIVQAVQQGERQASRAGW